MSTKKVIKSILIGLGSAAIGISIYLNAISFLNTRIAVLQQNTANMVLQNIITTIKGSGEAKFSLKTEKGQENFTLVLKKEK